jgi:hypothetical protein
LTIGSVKGFSGYPMKKADYLSDITYLFYYGMLYYGLKKRRGWAANFILYSNAYLFFISLFGVDVTTMTHLLAKYIWAGFAIFQIWFFTKSETKRFFDEASTTLF